jgi:hypothetical protein
MRKLNLMLLMSLVGCVVDEGRIESRTEAAIDVANCEPGAGRVYVEVRLPFLSCPMGPIGPWNVDVLNGRSIDDREICIYTLTGGGYATPAQAAMLPPDAEPECPATVPLSDPLDYVYPSYFAAYNRQMERATSLPYLPTKRRLPNSVRVAVIGSSLDSKGSNIEPTFGANPHERAVGMAIRQMACPRDRDHATSACIPQFKNYLALDWASGNPAPGGGDYGYMSTLALKIEEAVDDWKRAADGSRLIINLSVGWHPEYTTVGPYITGEPTAITVGHPAGQAVRAAIQYARCEGALVVAAVGNGSNNPSEVSNDGPMLPAAWAAERTRCPPNMTEPRDRMLHAVGGVDGTDTRLLLRRTNADTELVAPAFAVMPDNALANPDRPPDRLAPMTGSSFGAAGLTAAATIVWGYRPNLNPDQVVQHVYDNAQPLGWGAADVCNGACLATRRLSICRSARDAMLDACAAEGIACPVLPTCTPIAAGMGTNATLPGIPPGAVHVPDPGWEIQNDLGFCASNQVYADPEEAPSEAWCPAEHFDGVSDQPFMVAGQPDPDVCPACFVFFELAKPVIFYMDISPEWSPESPITGAVLELSNGTFNISYALGNLPAGPGDQYEIELPVLSKPNWGKITFTVQANVNGQTGPQTVTEQINIVAN